MIALPLKPCHHDSCTEPIAREAGGIITGKHGVLPRPPLAVGGDVAWVGCANGAIRGQVEGVLRGVLRERKQPDRHHRPNAV